MIGDRMNILSWEPRLVRINTLLWYSLSWRWRMLIYPSMEPASEYRIFGQNQIFESNIRSCFVCQFKILTEFPNIHSKDAKAYIHIHILGVLASRLSSTWSSKFLCQPPTIGWYCGGWTQEPEDLTPPSRDMRTTKKCASNYVILSKEKSIFHFTKPLDSIYKRN